MEDRIISNIDRKRERRQEVPAWIEATHEKAAKIVRESAIKPSEFIDLYGEEGVKSDEAYVKRSKLKFDRDNTLEQQVSKKLATIFEAVILEQSELSNWFGSNISTIKTSEYDDIARGVDMIAEYSSENAAAHLALGIDVSYSPGSVPKKLEAICKAIESNALPTVRYFKSEQLGMRGELKNIPKIILGVSYAKAMELANAWLGVKEGRLPKNTFVKHPVRSHLLREMQVQFAGFEKIAVAAKNEAVAAAYKRASLILEEALKEAASENISIQEVTRKDHDPVHDAIEAFMGSRTK